jgi:hypothetical protein
MGVEHLPRRLGALAKLLGDSLVRRRGGEDAQEAIGGGVACQLVVVPEQPAQDFAPFGVVLPTIFAEALDQVIEYRARLGQALPAVLGTGASPMALILRYSGVLVSR